MMREPPGWKRQLFEERIDARIDFPDVVKAYNFHFKAGFVEVKSPSYQNCSGCDMIAEWHEAIFEVVDSLMAAKINFIKDILETKVEIMEVLKEGGFQKIIYNQCFYYSRDMRISRMIEISVCDDCIFL